MTETEWTTCEVCGCKFAQTLMPDGERSKDDSCPALRTAKNQLDTCGEAWRERAIKHQPKWAD